MNIENHIVYEISPLGAGAWMLNAVFKYQETNYSFAHKRSGNNKNNTNGLFKYEKTTAQKKIKSRVSKRSKKIYIGMDFNFYIFVRH